MSVQRNVYFNVQIFPETYPILPEIVRYVYLSVVSPDSWREISFCSGHEIDSLSPRPSHPLLKRKIKEHVFHFFLF